MKTKVFALSMSLSLGVQAADYPLPDTLECTFEQNRSGHGGSSSWLSEIVIKKPANQYLPSLFQTVTNTSRNPLTETISAAYVTELRRRGENLFFISGLTEKIDEATPTDSLTVVVNQEVGAEGAPVWFATTIRKNASWGDEVDMHRCIVRP